MRPVKTPSPRADNRGRTHRETRLSPRGYVLLVVGATVAATPSLVAARVEEPLCEWLSGIGLAAQAQADRDFLTAERASRRALAARPHGAAAARAQAALGLAALSLEEAGAAAEALEVALGSPIVPARAHLAHARGEALLSSGDAHAAARLFSEAASASGGLALSRTSRLREAQALLGAGLAAEAVPVLEWLVAHAEARLAAESRLALARAQRAVGEEEQAAATFRALWLELVEEPESDTAGAALAAWRSAGGPIQPETGDEHVLRAERLLAAGRPDAALDELAAAGRADEPPTDADRLAVLRASAFLSLARYAEAERAALPLAGASAEGVQRGARLVLARASARAGRIDEAIHFYADVAASKAPVPGLPDWRQRDVGDEAAFLSAWLFYDVGEFERAIPALELFARKNPRSRRAEDALWFAAWSRYRLGHLGDAERAFTALSRGPLADGALYWRARIARSPARQRALYRASIAMSGEGWYGLLARARLGVVGGAPPRPRLPRARPLPEVQGVWAAGRLSVAVELLGLGLRDEALAELRDLVRSGRVRPAAALVAQLADFAGDAELQFRMARDHLLPTRRVARWGHPEPSGDALRLSARAFGVDPTLLLGILRRESRFREEARSGAGAEGLMQLRPATAERLAVLLGVPAGVRERLADPDANVTLGAHYLSLLLARFEEPLLAIAAYNAGPSAVAEWADARRGMPLDAWVESIPYRETRQYVKTVLVEWSTYRSLAGDPPPPLDPGRTVRPPRPGVSF